MTVEPLTAVGYDWATRTENEIHRKSGKVIGIKGVNHAILSHKTMYECPPWLSGCFIL